MVKLVSFMIILGFFVHAASPQKILFKQVSIEQGLSENSIYAIFQDSKGFMWFGTEAGLNKYDGYNFNIYKPKEGNTRSISNYFIYCITEDRRGFIWVGTDDGLNRFDTGLEVFTRYSNQQGKDSSLCGNKIYALFQDQKGSLWIGTDSGLNCYIPEKDEFESFRSDGQNPRSLSHNDVRSIAQDNDGRLWIGTFGGGLNLFDPIKKEFSQYRHNPRNANSLSDDFVNAVHADREGILWIGTRSGGLNRFDPGRDRFTCYRLNPRDSFSLSDNWINSILEDDRGVIWIGTNDGGLNEFDRKTEKFTAHRHNPRDPRSLCGDRILSLHRDRAAMYWVGSYGGGISKFRLEESSFIHYYSNPEDPTSLSSNLVRSFCVDRRDNLWAGTDIAGLNRLDRSTQRFRQFKNIPGDPTSLSNNRVFSIQEGLDGSLWVATYGGLNRLNPRTGLFTRYQHKPGRAESLSDDRIRSLCLGRGGIIWIGTDGGGMNRFDPKTGKFVTYRHDASNPDSIGYDRVFCVYQDPDEDTVWVACFGGGLNKFDPQTEKFVRYVHDPNNQKSISNNYVMPIVKARDGMIWLGSNGGGLTRFDPKREEFRSFTEDDGLPNNTVYGIMEDADGNLWMSTNRGICRFNMKTERVKNYDVSDGLQSNEFNGCAYYKSRDGWMYFGGINGFNEFDPRTIRDNPTIPPVMITDFQLMNRPVPVGRRADGRVILERSIVETKSIALSYRDSTIAFEYTALSFAAPEKNMYAHKLEGFDQDWNYTGKRRFVTYTNLPPKTYVFRVKGSNNDGVWNEQGKAISIRIFPPFWKTWWFTALGILFLALSAYGWYHWRVSKLEKTKRELEQLVALRTQELKDISLRDPLTGLRNRRFLSEVLADEINAFLKRKLYLIRHVTDRRKKEDSLVYGFLMIDIDHFKTINDLYGHDMGDRWLVEFSKIMRQCTRADDELIRYGGEEFLIVLKKTDPVALEQSAQKIKEELDKIDRALKNSDLKRTCSVGYTIFPFYRERPEMLSFELAVMMADLGLYYAKNNGRDMAVNVIPGAGKLPASEDELARMTTSLEFAAEKGFVTIKTSR